MSTRIISTPLPCNLSRKDTETLAQEVHEQLCDNNITDLNVYIQIANHLNININNSYLGGTKTRPLTMLCWDNDTTQVWAGGALGMYSVQLKNQEMLLNVAHKLLHLPIVYETYGDNSIMEVTSIICDDKDDKLLRKARIEAIWFALYLALPHEKLSDLIAKYGVDKARNYVNVTGQWFDYAVKRLEQVKNNG